MMSKSRILHKQGNEFDLVGISSTTGCLIYGEIEVTYSSMAGCEVLAQCEVILTWQGLWTVTEQSLQT